MQAHAFVLAQATELMLGLYFYSSCGKMGDTWYDIITAAQGDDIWSGVKLAKTKLACQHFF